eukprot:m51a1_g2684 hypothetical protein (264) ;mRNA; r:748013-748988
MQARASVLCVALIVAATRSAPSYMRLSEIHLTNNCALPVYMLQGGPLRIEPGRSVILNRTHELFFGWADGRISFSYSTSSSDKVVATVDMGTGFSSGFDVAVDRQSFAFVARDGFVMNLEVALWSDTVGGTLACDDCRARTTFEMSKCIRPDKTTYLDQSTTPDGDRFSRCVNRARGSEGCTSYYAIYVDDHSEMYNETIGAWYSSARSSGYLSKGFDDAFYADGRSSLSTETGRVNDEPACSYECYDEPCLVTSVQRANLTS